MYHLCEGKQVKLIELSQNRVAIVNNEDFVWLSKWKWCYHRGRKGCNTNYAERTDRSKPKQQTIKMHIAVMKRHKRWKRGKQVDHINTCGCDNRKVNLRLATRGRQRENQKRRTDNTSGVTGVHWHKQQNKWQARISIDGKRESLGLFPNKKDAIAARRLAEIKYFGEYRYNPKLLCPLWKTGQCPDCTKRAKELGLKP